MKKKIKKQIDGVGLGGEDLTEDFEASPVKRKSKNPHDNEKN